MFKGNSNAKKNSEASLKSEAGRFEGCCHSAFFLGCCHLKAVSPACAGLGPQGHTYIDMYG